MKKMLSILLACGLLLASMPLTAMFVYAQTEFAGGSGTEDAPYLIQTKEHLDNVRNHLDAHFKLANDIEFSEADFSASGPFYNSSRGWTPIGDESGDSFTGVFDGNGYCIKNLYAKNVSETYVGLFGCNGGTIKNLSMVDAYVYGRGQVGGFMKSTSVYVGTIAGSSYGTISNCCSFGSVHAEAENAGTAASASSFRATVYAGGVVGYNSGVVENCYNNSAVFTNSPFQPSPCGGGIAGCSGGTITCSYNMGDISSYYTGGIVGKLSGGSNTNCYYLDNLDFGVRDGQDTCIKLSLEIMTKQDAFSGFDFANVWTFDTSFGYAWPILQKGYVPVASDEQHVYDNNCDAECNFCGIIREVPHDYANVCDRDCNLCGFIRQAPHLYDSDCDDTCNLCGVRRKANQHTYDNACDNTCNNCGAIREIGDSHIYSDTCDQDCNNCGIKREPPHAYDDEYDDTCDTCGAWRDVPERPATITGITGDCVWTLIGTQLTISGTGVMADYSSDNKAPWGTSITSVILEEGVANVGDFAFNGCLYLTNVTLPESIVSIGAQCFAWCQSLSTITLPDSIETIERAAFYQCIDLVSINIPRRVIVVEDYLFAFCYDLTSITIPNQVTTIKEKAFTYCQSLCSITLPGGITEIGDGAFNGCSALKHVQYGGTQAARANISIAKNNSYLNYAIWSYHEHSYATNCAEQCLACGELREAPHDFYDNYDAICNTCGLLRKIQTTIPFGGNSISEDVSGLAFHFNVTCEGITMRDTTAIYDNATVDGYKLLGMGAVVTNGFDTRDVPAVYLCELKESSASFAVRIVNIPAFALGIDITATPYIILEIDGVATTIYGEAQTCSYNGAKN